MTCTAQLKNGFSLDPYTLVSHCYNNSELCSAMHSSYKLLITHFFFIVVAPEVLSYEPLGLYTDMW